LLNPRQWEIDLGPGGRSYSAKAGACASVVAPIGPIHRSIEESEFAKRPIGITILAIIFLAAGVSYMMLGFQMTTAVTSGPLPSGQGTWIWGWLVVLTGLAFWIGGLAAWRLQPFGWLLGHVLAIIGIIEAIFALLGTGNLSYALAISTFPFILLWYLNRASVKKAFGIVEE
jgi:hypothetical protein